MRAVQPVFDEWLSCGALALGDFILVMRENQIFAAQMQVKTLPQDFHAHGAALDMPSGTAFTKRAGPCDVAVVGRARFPERKIGDGFLGVFVILDAFAGAKLFKV